MVYRTAQGRDQPGFSGIYIDSLDITGPGIVAVIGRSGSGKSTLLSVLSGLKAPNLVSAGADGSQLRLLPGGEDSADLLAGARPKPGTVSFVFQESYLMKSLSVGLNVDMARALTRPRLDAARFAGLMTEFGLLGPDDKARGLRDMRVSDLSGGQQQRIAVARALAADPRVIFCDEPTSSLDAATARRIMEHLRGWALDSGATVIWVTHDEPLALEIADAVLCVDKGRVLSRDGAPLTLPPVHDIAARRAALDGLKAQGADLPALDDRLFDRNGLVLNPARAERRNANGAPRETPTPARFNLFGTVRFIWRFVLAELFPRQPADLNPPGWLRRMSRRVWGGPFQFTRPTFALIILLGILAAYATLFGTAVLDAKFARDLSRPEVSHYTLERFGDVDSTAEDLLSLRAVRQIESDLAARFAPEIADGARPPQVFGRRLELSVRAADLQVDCDGARNRAGNAVLVVFDHAEPLFRGLPVRSADGPPKAIGSVDKPDLRDAAFVTPDFLKRRFGIDPGDPVPDQFCFGTERLLKPVRIAGLIAEIPGSSVLSAEIAMTNDAYLRLMKSPDVRPNHWGNSWPPFDSAALYFDADYAEKLFCTIDACADRPELYDQIHGPGYKLNDDALAQVRRLLSIALGSRNLLFAVMTAMSISIAIAVALSVQAFIVSNERFLSIMRAVGYRLGHIVFLMLLELLVITLVATIAAGFVLVVSHQLLAARIARVWDLAPDWLDWSVVQTAQAVGLAYGLVLTIGLLVVVHWWRSHRDIGQKLQGV
ncbi:ATP-binding cassette domain-containing protein [Antarctobacter heliothermus]|uniref:ABC-type lipoprotein export system, ATPase component n=1 Tax=Antarctobacter heliothermus TaxID=74033 RepID=A0A239EDD3_9RHOB|nr:ATP-binding cassette domain-containing protein [Antarctobacter heliothermus]SNS41934.1 ABC-type lipoprotein export system, ATPase component [Antarctobacter heliothermus]